VRLRILISAADTQIIGALALAERFHPEPGLIELVFPSLICSKMVMSSPIFSAPY
jgi:hypothetical protein